MHSASTIIFIAATMHMRVVNDSCTCCAEIDSCGGQIRLFAIDGDCDAVHGSLVVFDGVGIEGVGALKYPMRACFVDRGESKPETLLFTDSGNHRIVEITRAGEFVRVIRSPFRVIRSPFRLNMLLCGIAYNERSDIIAVTTANRSASRGNVAVLAYSSGSLTISVGLQWSSESVHMSRADADIYLNVRVGCECLASNCGEAIFSSQVIRMDSKNLRATMRTPVLAWRPVDLTLCDDDDGGFVVARGPRPHFLRASALVFFDGNFARQEESMFRGHVTSVSRLGDDFCYTTNDGKMHRLRHGWALTAKNVWIGACICF